MVVTRSSAATSKTRRKGKPNGCLNYRSSPAIVYPDDGPSNSIGRLQRQNACTNPPVRGDLCTHFISAICRLDCRDRFGVFVSALENCVSRRRRLALVETLGQCNGRLSISRCLDHAEHPAQAPVKQKGPEQCPGLVVVSNLFRQTVMRRFAVAVDVVVGGADLDNEAVMLQLASSASRVDT